MEWSLQLSACDSALCSLFLVTPLEINGNSMLPVLHDHDEVLVRHYGTIKRFDIITFKLNNGETYIKRVIGLPGDEIKYENNQLYVNQKKVPEKFLTDPNLGETSDFTLDDFLPLPKSQHINILYWAIIVGSVKIRAL